MNKPFYGAASMPLSNRSTILNNLQVPGPGSYDYNKEKSHNDLPKWSLKKQIPHGSCFEELSTTPGPGVYQLETGFKKQQQKLITTKGQKYRHFMEKSYSHSPLNIPGCLNTKGGSSFGYREEVKEVQKSPGPVYHLDKIVEEERTKQIQNSFRGFGFGEKNIIYKKNDCSPGPGAFDIQQTSLYKSKTCEKWTFGSAKRSESPTNNPLGPGQYDPKVNSTLGRNFKLRGKNESKTIQTSNVGPGSYDLPQAKTKIGTRFNIRRTKQQGSKQQKQDDNLSPFSYNPPRYLDKTDTHGYSLGKRLESSLSQGLAQQPGPGSYQIGKNQVKGGGGYMGRKMQQKKKQSSTMDNFYKYDPKLNSVARQSPKFSFPQGRRSNQKENGLSCSQSQQFYQNINNKISGYSYSMGTSKRFVLLKKESGPFKDSQVEYSTIGQLPGYLRRGLKKK